MAGHLLKPHPRHPHSVGGCADGWKGGGDGLVISDAAISDASVQSPTQTLNPTPCHPAPGVHRFAKAYQSQTRVAQESSEASSPAWRPTKCVEANQREYNNMEERKGSQPFRPPPSNTRTHARTHANRPFAPSPVPPPHACTPHLQVAPEVQKKHSPQQAVKGLMTRSPMYSAAHMQTRTRAGGRAVHTRVGRTGGEDKLVPRAKVPANASKCQLMPAIDGLPNPPPRRENTKSEGWASKPSTQTGKYQI
eukprot:357428-Chlamydomonas_euryale.AAC.3